MSKKLFSEFVDINPKVPISKGETYPCIMMEELEPGRRYVYPRVMKQYKGGARFENGDTLFARITPCLENGKIAQFISKDKTPAFGSTEFIILRAKEGISDPGYVYYLSTTDTIRKPAEKSMFGVSGRQRADVKSIESIKLDFPDLPTQQRIASILSAYDDLIENNTRRIKILEEMAKLIYREWFVEFNAPGIKLRKATAEEKKVTGKDQFPEGWEVKILADIAQENRRGINPKEIDPNTPYFGLEHLPRKSIALENWGNAKEVHSTKLAFSKGEILFGKIRPYFHKVGVAPIDGVCSSDIIVIGPKSEMLFSLVLSCVSSEDFVKNATQSSQGTKMPRANWDVLLKYPIMLPNTELLKDFNDLYNCKIDLINNLVLTNRNLRRTRDLLLPKLVSGEIDV